jgi:xylan 1,4-beta-xylosidase
MSYDDQGHCNSLQIEEAKVGVHRYISEQVDLKNDINEIRLAVNVTAGQSQFEYSVENQWHQIGKQNSAEYLSDDYIKNHGKLAFTGAMVGICVQDLDQHHAYADFKYFDYQELHK